MNKRFSHIAEKVQQQIDRGVPMHSRFYFILKEIAVWALATISVLIGALSVSSIIFRFSNIGKVLPPHPMQAEVVRALFDLLPLVWVLLMVLFGYFAYREIRATKRGYKYEFSTLMLTLTLASVVSGIGLYAVGGGFALDRFAATELGLHKDIEMLQQERWLRPEEGFLVGEVSGQTGDVVLLTDPKGVVWEVTLAGNTTTVSVGDRVGLHGKIENGEVYTFTSCDMRPLEIEGRGMFPRPVIEIGGRGMMLRMQNGTPLFEDRDQFERKSSEERSNECEEIISSYID